MSKKVFFCINFRRPVDDLSSLRKSILADLNALGYNEKHQRNLLYYNAFLAHKARALILSGTLDETGKEKLMSEARESGCETTTVEQAWLETTDSVMNRVSRLEENMNAILNYSHPT